MRTYGDPVRRKIRGKATRCYYLQEYDATTRRQRWVNTHATSMEAARTFRRTMEVRDASDTPEKKDRAIGEALAAWLDLKSTTMTPAGLAVYEGYSGRWTGFFGKAAVLREITPQHVEDYFRRRALTPRRAKGKKKATSPTTLNKERRAMKQFFRWASGHGFVDEADPVRTVGAFQQEEREIRALSQEEQESLLRACREPYKVKALTFRNAGGTAGGSRTKDKTEWEQTKTPPAWLAPLVRLALATGLRQGNLLDLRWGDVDLEHGEIKIPARRMKKRRDFRLPLDADTVAFLRDLRGDATTMMVLDLPDRRVVTRAFEKAVDRAGVAPCRFHDLRVTFVSDLGRAGVAIDVARQLAGHRSIVTTAKHYRGIGDEELRAAMEKRSAGA